MNEEDTNFEEWLIASSKELKVLFEVIYYLTDKYNDNFTKYVLYEYSLGNMDVLSTNIEAKKKLDSLFSENPFKVGEYIGNSLNTVENFIKWLLLNRKTRNYYYDFLNMCINTYKNRPLLFKLAIKKALMGNFKLLSNKDGYLNKILDVDNDSSLFTNCCLKLIYEEHPRFYNIPVNQKDYSMFEYELFIKLIIESVINFIKRKKEQEVWDKNLKENIQRLNKKYKK